MGTPHKASAAAMERKGHRLGRLTRIGKPGKQGPSGKVQEGIGGTNQGTGPLWLQWGWVPFDPPGTEPVPRTRENFLRK